MAENILITGVSGYIGMKIAHALADHPGVAALVGIDIRHPENGPETLIFIKHDVRNPLSDLMKEHRIDTVIHAAYVLAPIHDTGLMEDINVSGTRNVLESCMAAGVSHLVYTSSATAYGFHPDNDVPLREDSPLRGNHDFTYAKNKREIEGIFKDFIGENPEITVTILRPCFVVGPGFDNPLARYLQKKVVILPSETSPMQFVHEDDLIRIMVLSIEKKITGTFNVGGAGILDPEEMVRILGVGFSMRLPTGLLYPLNQLFWKLRLGFITRFPSPGMNLMRYSWVVSQDKLIDRTGFAYAYSTRTAWEDFTQHVRNRRNLE
ncbi:MAG: NAD-dependent epimerase/dehydratase family protein [Desulfobacterium sp.]|nr:NAD-dependent epimerase/dehydratase family protein [Desulfobacterium sp.]